MPKPKEILCFSNLQWAERTTRRQMIMSRMRDVKVVWLDPPGGRSGIRGKRPAPFKPYPHVTVYSSNGFLSPGSSFFRADPIRGQRGYLAYVRDILKREELSAPLLWLYSPVYAPLITGIYHEGLVYDCADLPDRLPGKKSVSIEKQAISLCRRADVVFAARRDLYRKLAGINPKTYLLPNGIDYRPKKDSGDPRTGSYPRPIVGFAGDVSEAVDLDLIEEIGRSIDGTLVLATTGEMRDKLSREDFIRITSGENVVPFITDSQPVLLDAVSDFDVCIAPYLEKAEESDLRSRVFFACLASGKPIVSTRHSALIESFPDCVYTAGDNAEFLGLLKKAAADDDPARRERQRVFADGCRWEARISEIRRLLAREGYLLD